MKPSSLLSDQNRGFALVATPTLIVLLAILFTGLLNISLVSLQHSTQEKPQIAAEANARLALASAIGERCKSLGPDQRISVPATVISAFGNPGYELKFPDLKASKWMNAKKPEVRFRAEYLRNLHVLGQLIQCRQKIRKSTIPFLKIFNTP